MSGTPLSPSAEEYLTWLAVEQGRSRQTLLAYRRDLAAYEEFLAARNLGLEDATEELIDAHLADRRAAGLAPASVGRALAPLRGLYRFRVEEGWAAKDPTQDVTPPRLPLRLPKALSEEEVLLVLSSAQGDEPLNRRDRAILEVLYGTGIRVSELTGLSFADLGSESGLLRVLGKGDKERLVPLGDCAADALCRWLEPGGRPRVVPTRFARRGDAEAVFLNARGGRLTRQGVWEILQRRARRVGLEDKVHPHVLRHSCATHMLARGADIRVVQELLGHASVATTQLYTKVTLDHLRRVYERAHPRAGTPAGQ
jgi:integrase/recombinase XerD